MVQSTDITLSNQSGSSYRAEHNSINQAAFSLNKGGTAPSYAIIGTPWIDDSATPWVFKIYDGTDWIECFNIDSSNDYITLPLANSEKFIAPNQGTLTISSGAITVTGSHHKVDTEGAASSDTLTTISGGADGQRLLLGTVANGRDVIIQSNTGGGGNIVNPLGSDLYLNSVYYFVELVYVGALSKWMVIGGNITSNDASANFYPIGGISFDSGTNVLDEFDDGSTSWTPSFAGVSVTETVQTGTYHRVGNDIKAKGFITFNSLNTSDGSAIRFNLPVAASTSDPIIFALQPVTTTGATFAATDVILGICPSGTGAEFELYDPSGTAYTYDGGEMAASGDFDFYVSYTAA